MPTDIVVDSGPIVAIFNRQDNYHHWCVRQLEQITHPLLTCDAVLSEAFFLLKRRTPNGSTLLEQMLLRGVLRSNFEFSVAQSKVLSVLKKYRDLPTSFADACLVAMADSNPDAKIWTLDHHFQIYRKPNRRVIPLLSPNRSTR